MNFVKAATSEGLADADGVPHSNYLNYYEKLAENRELAIIITGHIAVSKEGRSEPRQVFTTSGEQYPFKLRCRNLQKMTDKVHNMNSDVKIIAQLSHGGRQINRMQLLKNGSQNLISPAPSAIKKSVFMFGTPNKSIQSAKYVKDQFIQAFEQMASCGFDGIQLHCAHGYLLDDCIKFGQQQFVYDLVKEIIERRDQINRKFIISVKISAESQHIDIIKELCKLVDIVELSKGNYESPDELVNNQRQKYSFSFIEQNQQLLQYGARIICTGGFISKEEAYQYQLQQRCHFIGLARLYCLPQQTRVERIKFNVAVEAMKNMVPLCCAGPATVFYEECIRRRARGIAKTNQEEMRRITFIWWLLTLLMFMFGMQRYTTQRDLGRK